LKTELCRGILFLRFLLDVPWRRLGLAQAIMEDPEILILDEPANGLNNWGRGGAMWW